MSILVVGSVALDTVTTPFGRRKDILGGSATYFSLSASHFSQVNLVAAVGRDFPKKYLNLFKSKGVDTRGLTVEDGKTFRWAGVYGWDFSDPKTTRLELNVFAHFRPKIPKAYTNCQYVFLANIDPVLQYKVLKQIKNPGIVVTDTINYWIEHKRRDLIKLLKHIDIFFLNESEARKLTRERNIAACARAILKLGPKRVIIKKGEHGAMLFSRQSVFCVPAYLLERVIDPTGAGDTFAGGVVGYLAKCGKINDANLRKAMVYGSIMATFAVEDFSPKLLAKVSQRDISRRMKKFIKLTCF